MYCVLSTAYLGPIQYYSKIIGYEEAYIEKHEHYQKQTYRNRCVIYAANGCETLTIPIAKIHNEKMPINEVRISYDTPWQKLHLGAIESAYRNSPFYEYYIDELLPFYQKKFDLLFEFNIQLLTSICELLDIKPNVRFTEKFLKDYSSGEAHDFRYGLQPKSKLSDTQFISPSYMQVFEPKYGFKPNLSIIDLLFNVGPETLKYIKASYSI